MLLRDNARAQDNASFRHDRVLGRQCLDFIGRVLTKPFWHPCRIRSFVRIGTTPTQSFYQGANPPHVGYQPDRALPFRPIPGEVPFARFLEANNQTRDAANANAISLQGLAARPVEASSASEAMNAPTYAIAAPKIGDVSPTDHDTQACAGSPQPHVTQVVQRYAATGRILDIVI